MENIKKLNKIIVHGTSTNVGPTNIGRYKGRTVQTSDPISSDVTKVGQYKRRTGTNVEPRLTSDQYKRQTGTFIRKNVGLWLRPLL